MPSTIALKITVMWYKELFYFHFTVVEIKVLPTNKLAEQGLKISST